MKLLLHACCGPCSLEPIRLLDAAGHSITIAYMNSNIHPAEEYARRIDALRTWAKDQNIPVVEGVYDPESWERAIEGAIGSQDAVHMSKTALPSPSQPPALQANGTTLSENPPVKVALYGNEALREDRCRACYRLRFEEAARYAAKHGLDGICTTLSVSPFQYTETIFEELIRAATAQGLVAIAQDFRPFYDEATKRSRALGMYRQNYCGCRFSLAESEAERRERKRVRAAEKEAKRARQVDTAAALSEERAIKQAERLAYSQKQEAKRRTLKALREQAKETNRQP